MRDMHSWIPEQEEVCLGQDTGPRDNTRTKVLHKSLAEMLIKHFNSHTSTLASNKRLTFKPVFHTPQINCCLVIMKDTYFANKYTLLSI